MRSSAIALCLACALAAPSPSCSKGPLAPSILDIAGARHAPTDVTGDAVHVLVFTSHECPIANSYAPTLGALQEAWQQTPRVRLFLVHVDPDLSAADALAHAQDYALPGTVLLDPTHAVTRACGATMTPEAVVLTAQGTAYKGRIDDQWRRLGSRAPVARTRDLADAVRAALAGERVETPFTAVVGCLLPEPRR